MTDKENKIADILLDFYDEYHSNEINRPMIPSIYASKILDSLQEELVSEELEEVAKSYSNNLDNICGSIGEQTRNAFKAGAKWQFNQLEKNRLAACDRASKEEIEREQDFCDKIIIGEHRQPTFSDAIEYGMNLQKQQMMAKDVDVEVKVDAGGYPYIPQIELYDYDKDVPLAKEGDKYNVVLIKEE